MRFDVILLQISMCFAWYRTFAWYHVLVEYTFELDISEPNAWTKLSHIIYDVNTDVWKF